MSIFEKFQDSVNNIKNLPGRVLDTVADIKRTQLETRLDLAKKGVLVRPISNDDADILSGFESHPAYSEHLPNDPRVQAAVEHLEKQLG